MILRDTFDEKICATDGGLIFFPVRHHSPACARLVSELIATVRPALVLIEGPSDFNEQLSELFLAHQLPLAIYSYTHLPGGKRSGAFYPFCIYSPEWQALQTAHALAIPTRFIDLPWRHIVAFASQEVSEQRYNDGELRRSDYTTALCAKLGIADFNTLWDTLFEIDDRFSLAEFMERCHRFCYQVRRTDPRIPSEDIYREKFMAARIKEAISAHTGPILVVTGGFHSYALYERLLEINAMPDKDDNFMLPVDVEHGIALTPYSYARLDSLAGYEAGMPHPEFYHQIWQNRQGTANTPPYRIMLDRVILLLRTRGQMINTADLISLELMAQGLAALRGHREIWRTDLVDGIIGALIKEDAGINQHNPFLEAVYEALRGDARGYLAVEAKLPPLVHDIKQILAEQELLPAQKEQRRRLDLHNPAERIISGLLHRLRILQIPGYTLSRSTDLVGRRDLSEIWEEWEIQWRPEFEAGCIEAAIYGPTLLDAALAKLLERSKELERSAEDAALLLLDGCLMNLSDELTALYDRLIEVIRQDGNFLSVTAALGHLLYLYKYDIVLQIANRITISVILPEVFGRALWLLETSGQTGEHDRQLPEGIKTLLETWERCPELPLDRGNFRAVLDRVSDDPAQAPWVRGATLGILWLLGEAEITRLVGYQRYFADPAKLGDFLSGLFYIAREAAQRQPDLVLSLDELLLHYDDEEFLQALPALRLAFSYFTPREKHYLATTLLESAGQSTHVPLPELVVPPELAARNITFENNLFRTIERYGLLWKGEVSE